MDAEELATIPFFAELTPSERTLVAECAKRLVVPAGLVITVLGERGDAFYVIEDGRAYVSQESERLAELGPGDFFGEIALLDPAWRTASVQAVTSMHLVVLPQRPFGELVRSAPEVAERITAVARERIERSAAAG